MEREKIKVGKTYGYATPSSTGTFKVSDVYQDGNNSWWVSGFDKAKKKDIPVRPAQVYAVSK